MQRTLSLSPVQPSIEETITALRALERGVTPRGRTTTILTNVGGAGIIAADACERADIVVAALLAEVRVRLSSFLPAEAGLGNPFDMIATAGSQAYENALRVLLGETDAAIVIFRPPLVLDERSERVAEGILKASSEFPDKPVLVCTFSHGPAVVRFNGLLETAGIPPPAFTMPGQAVDALAMICRLAEVRAVAGRFGRDPRTSMPARLQRPSRATYETRPTLTFEEGAELLAAYGIDACRHTYAATWEEVERFAAAVGYPLVAKVDAPGLYHRFERGAVIPGIAHRDGLVEAVDRLQRLIDAKGIAGGRILLQPLVVGRELILGMERDPTFGPVVMFGVGGTLVEALNDVSFGVAPISAAQATRMIRSIRAFPLLSAFRGLPPVDVSRSAEALSSLGEMALDHPAIEEVDLNPFIASETATAVDILIRLEETAQRS